MRIDAHQHFWIFDSEKDAWITDEMKIIQRNFLPNDISLTLKERNFDGVVAVQADQSPKETEFLLEISKVYALIKGIVGWTDLRSEHIDEQLENYSKYPIIKGFRHIVEAEEDPDFLSTDEFLRGISSLTKWNFTYDLLIKPKHYQSTLQCVSSNPNQRFVLDHMAKPDVKSQIYNHQWQDFIQRLSEYPNVYCKISGLGTQADWNHWEINDFKNYILHVIQCFGKQRIMFGSDWPVCLLAGTFQETEEMIRANLFDFSESELSGFLGNNAVKFYGLK